MLRTFAGKGYVCWFRVDLQWDSPFHLQPISSWHPNRWPFKLCCPNSPLATLGNSTWETCRIPIPIDIIDRARCTLLCRIYDIRYTLQTSRYTTDAGHYTSYNIHYTIHGTPKCLHSSTKGVDTPITLFIVQPLHKLALYLLVVAVSTSQSPMMVVAVSRPW